jgi:hypothetical protein
MLTALPENDADALKHVGVLTVYKILLINICAFVVLDNKLYTMYGTYIKIPTFAAYTALDNAKNK